MKFSEKAKNLRSETGLTQQQLSKHLGITASAIGYLENGQREPTGNTLIAYAKFFNVSIDSLVGLEPDLEDINPIPAEDNRFSKKTMFSDKSKYLRKEKNLSQVELAKALNVSKACISMIEIGKNEPTANTLIKYADFFKVSTDWLLDRADDFGNVTVTPRSSAPSLAPDEQRLLDLFRKLNRVNRDRLSAYAEVRLEEQEGSPYYRPAK